MQNCKIQDPPLLAQNQILSWHFHIKMLSKWPSENTREDKRQSPLQFQAMKLKIKIAWRINASHKGFWDYLTSTPYSWYAQCSSKRFILTGSIIIHTTRSYSIFIHKGSSKYKVVIEYFFRKQKSNQKLVMPLEIRNTILNFQTY